MRIRFRTHIGLWRFGFLSRLFLIPFFLIKMPASEPISSTLPPVLCRLLIGHDAERLEKPNKEGRTHRWKVFVRSPNEYPDFNDRSFIKKVVFQLHTTFDKPKRTIRSPPFGELI